MNMTIHGGNATCMTMSSLEISSLTSKRHDHVLRDIRAMLIGLYGEAEVSAGIPDKDMFEVFCTRMGWGIDSPKLGDERIYGVNVIRDARGYVSKISLDYKHTMTLISGYSVKIRKTIIDRWQQLEEQALAPVDPANFSRMQLIQLALDAETERLALEIKYLEVAPKAEALDRIAEADGAMNPTVAAKTLQIPPGRLFRWLRENQWIYRRPGSCANVAYQDKINAGYLTHKITTVHREDGSEKVVEQVLVTGKGLTKLAQVLGMQ